MARFRRNFAPIFLALMLLDSTAQSQSPALAPQRAALTQVGQALSRVAVKAKRVNEALGYGFGEGPCVFGVRLRPGAVASETFALQAGQSYVFIGGGDKTARNLDLILRDASGRVVSRDIEADAAPFLLFQPKVSGRYGLSLALKSGWRGSAFCAFTMLRKGATQVPLERLVEAAIKLDFAAMDAFRAARGGVFNQAPGTWALYGAVLRPHQTLRVPPRRYPATRRGLVAVGDNSALALDTSLLDAGGKPFARQVSSRVAPSMAQNLGAGIWAARVSNLRSSGPAMVLAVLLDLPQSRSAASQAAATPAPHAPQMPPFEGDYAGEDAQGAWKMRAKKGGDVSGHLAVPGLKLSAKFEGAINPNGTIYLRFTQSRQDYFAEGTWKWSDENRQKMTGQLVFTSRGAEVGRAEFALEKRDEN